MNLLLFSSKGPCPLAFPQSVSASAWGIPLAVWIPAPRPLHQLLLQQMHRLFLVKCELLSSVVSLKWEETFNLSHLLLKHVPLIVLDYKNQWEQQQVRQTI